MLELLMGFGVKSPTNCDPETLMYGTVLHGYYGEVPPECFIDGISLANSVGLIAGTPRNNDAGWLKFSLAGKTLYVAKKPLRGRPTSGGNYLNWNSLNSLGIVTGTKTIVIKDKTYKVRLLKGRGDGLTTDPGYGNDTAPTRNSEWNRLMYHVSASPNNGAMTSEGIAVGDWAQFTNDELGSVGIGSFSLCQESFMVNTDRWAVVRYGGNRVAGIVTYAATDTGSTGAWRPCLELVG